MPLPFLELSPILIYLAILLYLGIRSKSQTNSLNDFILGGRQLTLPAFTFTLVSTWYGGILGVGEFTYLYGLSNWIVFGLPYYVFAILFAYFIAPKIQATSFLSIPDSFAQRYGKIAKILSGIFTFFMALPAPYILMLGLLIHFISGLALFWSIILGACFSVIYVLWGGFDAVVKTDRLQFLLMFGGFFILVGVLFFQYGGISFLNSNLPALHLTWHGGNDLNYILIWFFIALWTFVDPGFHQRCLAAKTPEIARKGILISVVFWFVFDLLTTTAGLYARALLHTQEIDPALSFPILGHQVLPPLLSGIFITGLLAAIMSTVDSLGLLSAITLGYDLNFQKVKSVSALKLGLIISAIVSVMLAIYVPSIIQMWLFMGNVFIPPMLLPMLAVYFPKVNPGNKAIVLSMTLSFLTAFAFLVMSILNSPSILGLQFWQGIPPMYPGFVVSGGIFVGGVLIKVRDN